MKQIGAIAALALFAGPALAGSPEPAPADLVVAAPAPAPVYAGTDWTGFYAGAQLGYGNLDVSGGGTGSDDGVVGGVHAGYNHDFGSYVLGAEIDYDAADITLPGGAGTLDGIARLKLRGGYDFGRTLVYGTLGAAYADGSFAGVSGNDTGYVAGAGVDYWLNDRITLGGEALYNRFDNFESTGADLEATTLSARVTFHF